MADLLFQLPPGFVRLNTDAKLRLNAESFPTELLADLYEHVGRQTHMLDAAPRLVRMERDGKIAFAMAPNGDPAVFSANKKYLTPDEAALADAAVSYFDSQGTFRQATGEIDDPEAELAKVRADVEALRLEIEQKETKLAQLWSDFDQGLRRLPEADGAALAVLCHVLDANPRKVLESFLQFRKEHPEQGPVPLERFVKSAADMYVKHWDEQHPDDPVPPGFQQEIRAIYTKARADEVLELRNELTQLPEAKDLPFGQTAALAFLAHVTEMRPERVLSNFHLWRTEYPDTDAGQFFDYLVNDQAKARTINAEYQEFKAYVEQHVIAPQPGDPVYQVPEASLDDWINEEYPDAIHRLSSATNVSRRVVREVLERWVNAGVIKFVRIVQSGKAGGRISGILPHGWPQLIDASRSERLLKEEFTRQFKMLSPQTADTMAAHNLIAAEVVDARTGQWIPKEAMSNDTKFLAHIGSEGETAAPPPRQPRPGEHTYMRAIEAQYGALTDMIYMANKARAEGLPPELAKYHITVEELFEDDIPALKRADTFCWFEEPVLAVQAAAATLPANVRLTRELTEHYACWWYFTLPPEVKTNDDSEAVQALLWSWDDNRICFSTYVQDHLLVERSAGQALFPTAKFYWIEGETLAHMLQRNAQEFQERPLVGQLTAEENLLAIEQVARFFIAGCVWIQQTILVQSKGTIERHARKRMDKAQVFTRPLSDVQIIQLRRRESVTPAKTDGSKPVEWSCRWIVGGATGFWRNQYYPSKGRYELKYIAPFMKGPADKPLKIPQHRVYAVSR